jgi:hypothetical protein
VEAVVNHPDTLEGQCTEETLRLTSTAEAKVNHHTEPKVGINHHTEFAVGVNLHHHLVHDMGERGTATTTRNVKVSSQEPSHRHP